MQITILDGRDRAEDECQGAYQALVQVLAPLGDVQEFPLREIDIAPCLGCFFCWVRTPGECIQKRGGEAVTRAVINSDLVVFFTPVRYGGYGSVLKIAVDHLIPNISPNFARINGETHHQKRYPRYPDLFMVGVLPAGLPPEQADQQQVSFVQLAARNALNFYPQRQAAVVLPAEQAPAVQSAAISAAVAREWARTQPFDALLEVPA
jgi:hypothetical protein